MERKIEGYYIENAPSSNDVARDFAEQGAPEGVFVMVGAQSKGRGRMGRSFISNEDNGLYMSIILRPKLKVMDCQLISVLASVAVYEAIYDVTGIKAQIKWVNDIYIGDKKVCGILNEGTIDNTNERYKYVVCGIGVNIEPPKNGFADEISGIATSLYERGKAPDGVKNILAREIVKGFFKHYDKIEEREFLETYEKASYLIGKEVDVYTEKEVISGVARGFDENGNLIIEDENGVYHGFYSGEARVRKKGTDL